jgi:4-aminobutyrate aminotransferase-like enzyme
MLPALRAGVIYNDPNDYNVLVRGGLAEPPVVAGFIDFGDVVRSAVVTDPAIAAAYAMQGKADPLTAAAHVVAGYHSAYPLTDAEIALLFPLMGMRLSVSVVNAAYQRHAAPDNEYLTISEEPSWTLLEQLDAVHPRLAHYRLRDACELAPCPDTPALARWLREHPERVGPIVEGTWSEAGTIAIDLSVGGTLIGDLRELSDVEAFTRKVFDSMRARGARFGIGRYDEARPVYTAPQFAVAGNDGPEWRTIHLGLDIFAEPGTAVLAPLDGVVHSVRDNALPLDYGPTIIVRHTTGDGGPAFYTLYGHLSADSLDGVREGMTVARGARIGAIGDARVNGGWPPHLHFQIVTDLLDRVGEFPGVALPSQRRLWRGLSPDPNLMARVPAEVLARDVWRGERILAARNEHVGRALSVSYRKPLTIVRGSMQYLYDEDGRAYLDAVNNVAHVGHSHPRVVRAAGEQMAVLNTNTRYLHEHLVRYAERLSAMFPDPLRVCFFVNSGSEANELALRLARTYTGRTGMVVVDVAYHGNSTALIEISPYKHDGPGGRGAPPYVQAVPMPDVYRGLHRAAGPEAGRGYAAHVPEAIAALRERGHDVAGFICESILSCGGQIVLPDGYLAAAYAHIRAAGGVCIADEVQVGLGRVGTHRWAFETQRATGATGGTGGAAVVPDIVTLGKPIGNGHPLGAVITTPEIAAAFDNGMEYFNTFGGNPVSCAVGLAVLDVLEEEELQANAQRVGTHLVAGLRELQQRHALVGDVRGLGLFVGIELVTDRETLAPAAAEAAYIVNRMKDRGILSSTDGPLHNVIKIKPPLVFTTADADRLVATLDEVLREGVLNR